MMQTIGMLFDEVLELAWVREEVASGRAEDTRRRSHLSYRTMADGADVSKSTVYRWEHGRTLPRGRAFAHYFRLSGFKRRLEEIVRGASFAPMGEVLQQGSWALKQ